MNFTRLIAATALTSQTKTGIIKVTAIITSIVRMKDINVITVFTIISH